MKKTGKQRRWLKKVRNEHGKDSLVYQLALREYWLPPVAENLFSSKPLLETIFNSPPNKVEGSGEC